MRGDQRVLIAGAALVVGFLALMLWLVSREPRALTGAAAGTHPVVASRVTPVAPVVAAPAPSEQVTPMVPPAAPPIELPPDTQRLAEEFVPGTTEWEEVPVVEDGTRVLRFLPAHYNVIAPAPIVLWLEVVERGTGKRVALPAPHARVRPFAGGDWIEVAMVDNGEHRYVATLTPTPAQQQRLLGRVVAEGVVTLPEAGTRRIPQALIYTLGPRAHLTGVWRDKLESGHLVLSAQVQVEVAGTFSLMGQLVGPGREPIALTRTMTQLAVGTQWLTMRVWGKAIRDAAVDGPYEVRNVLLTRDMNERGDYDPGPTIALAHRTRGYRASDFSDAVYVEPAVSAGEQIGADHPSQRTNPPALYGDGDRHH